MTPHNEAKPGDYAQAVLLPGDPLRAKWIAEEFLEQPRQVNAVRNCLGFTGQWKGRDISVQATGMGQPSTAIYVHELINFYGANMLIRVGTSGGLTTKVKVNDIVLGMAASTDSAMNTAAFTPFVYAPFADFALLRRAVELAEERELPHHVGGIVSGDTFYHGDPAETYSTLARHNVLAVEMETSTLYTLAARHGARALSVCTVSDCLITGQELDATARQNSLHHMIELALDTAVSSSADV